MTQQVKNMSAMQETQEMQVRYLGREDPLEVEMATHSNILAWKTPLTQETGRLQSMESQTVGYDFATEHNNNEREKVFAIKIFLNL